MFVWGYAKVLLASLVTGAAVMLAVSAWQLRHGGDRDVFTRSARPALTVLVPAILFTMLVGDELGVIEAKYQPMKIAAAEAQPASRARSRCSRSAGQHDQTRPNIPIPHLLSLLATDHWNGKVVGLNPLQAQYIEQYGPGYYVPNVFIQYWEHAGDGLPCGPCLPYLSVGLWLIHRKKLATSRVFLWVAVWVGPASSSLRGSTLVRGCYPGRDGTPSGCSRSRPSLGVMYCPVPAGWSGGGLAEADVRGTC